MVPWRTVCEVTKFQFAENKSFRMLVCDKAQLTAITVYLYIPNYDSFRFLFLFKYSRVYAAQGLIDMIIIFLY
jgi:hypothetical protein